MDSTSASTDESVLASSPVDSADAAADLAAAVAQSAPMTSSAASHASQTSALGPITSEQLADLLVALGGSIDCEDELVSMLQRAVDVAHQAIPGADSCGVTIHLGGLTYTAVHTDQRTLAVDEQQYSAGSGPCLHAAETGETVLVDTEATEQLWPEFAAAAKLEGIRSFLAAPLRSTDANLGALNLYGRSPAAFDTIDAKILTALTTTVSRAIAEFARYASALEVAESLRFAIENRGPIEQAKGMLMVVHQIGEDAAFELLRTQSQATNRKLRDVAKDLVANLSNSSQLGEVS